MRKQRLVTTGPEAVTLINVRPWEHRIEGERALVIVINRGPDAYSAHLTRREASHLAEFLIDYLKETE